VVHELTTNALKYGALKQPGGALTISWNVEHVSETEAVLAFDWTETGVSISSQPEKRGFGRELIERILAFSPETKSQMNFGADGVACHIEMAINERSNTAPAS
jgi:two-component system CheB/CheR fusion protein